MWDTKSKLGDNAQAGEELVLLIRGELLRRYPNSVIYAVKAVVREDGQFDVSDERHPLFRGTLKPDVTFLGFDLKREDAIAIADPSWFFIIQEQPTEPRFGLDAADPPPELKTWNNLSWQHLVKPGDDLKALSHATINPVLPDIQKLSDIDKAKWGRNSAHQAYITLQRPVRIAIHAREMILQSQK